MVQEMAQFLANLPAKAYSYVKNAAKSG